jgi:hypothetical protein
MKAWVAYKDGRCVGFITYQSGLKKEAHKQLIAWCLEGIDIVKLLPFDLALGEFNARI